MARLGVPDGDGTLELEVVDTESTGRPVVLIHGWPLSHQSWASTAPALVEAGYRVISYDRRGFGDSDKPLTGYTYDHLADDLSGLLERLELEDVTLVGFSMGGGEVARYVARHGEDRLRSVVLASSVTPYMAHGHTNPDGPLGKVQATEMTASLTVNRDKFFDGFITDFFSVDGRLVVSEEQRREALSLTEKADKKVALQTMAAFGFTDFRDDLARLTVPTLVIHGDGDATVPFEGSGRRTHDAVAHSELHVVHGGPHGINISHADEFNRALLAFLNG